jgi:D-glycero-D-manno-heptose 1,7-bisphosphate phosphatase
VDELSARFGAYRLWMFDADGTLRRTTVPGQPCPRADGEWEALPGVRDVLTSVAWNRAGTPHLGLASNQDQVGAGLIPFQVARGLLRALALEVAGVHLPDAALQICPHALGVHCQCRKPRPGMLRALMAHYDVPAGEAVFVGDSAVDRGAAKAAGVAFVDAAVLFGWTQSA